MISINMNLVYNLINVIVLFLVLKHFLFQPVLGIMQKREELIQGQLDHAAQTQKQADELKKQYQNESEILPKNEIIFIPVPVVYDDYIKDNLVDDTIKMVIDYYNKRAVRTKDGDISVASDTLLDLIFLINPLLKHRGFKGECECRFVENYVEKAKDNYQIKFRNRGGIILPYIKYKMVDVNCRPIKRWPIHEIVIGPGLNQSKVIQSVKYFLEKKGMEDLADKVVASDIPYVET